MIDELIQAKVAPLQARIAELEAEREKWNEDRRVCAELLVRSRERVLAEREACAAWHDRQAIEYAESIKKAHHPADAQRMQDHLDMHVNSAAAIRARPTP